MKTEDLLAARGSNYGDFTDCAKAQQAIKRAVHAGLKYDELPDIMREALDLICHKIGRIVTGNPYHADSWADICGYSQLVIDRIEDGVGLKQPVAPELSDEARGMLGTTLDLMQSRIDEQIKDVTERVRYATPEEIAVDKTLICPHIASDTKTALGGAGFKVGPIEPVGPGTPEDGGHHARQAEEPEPATLILVPDDVGKLFRTRAGELVQVISFAEGQNYPARINGGHSENPRLWFRTQRGRVNWQIEPHADDVHDLVERVEVAAI